MIPVTRQQIVACARQYLGAPWRHQGHSAAGMDCVGLLLRVGIDTGQFEEGIQKPAYGRLPDGSFLSYFHKHMRAVPRSQIKNGAALVFSWGGSPMHAGIMLDVHSGAIIHATAQRRKVVVDTIQSGGTGRVFVGAFDYPGVTDG